MPPQPATAPADDRGVQDGPWAVRPIDRRMLIDGVLAEAENGQKLPSVNPATGEILGFAPDCTTRDTERAVAAARRSFDETSRSTDIAFRVRCLNQLHAALVEHREELRRLTVAETGATWRLTEGPYLDAAIATVGQYADSLTAYPMTERLGDVPGTGRKERRWVEEEPVGLAAIVVGSNHPTRIVLTALGPALAAGCTAVLKGAPEVALTMLALGELIATCTDIPAGVVNVLSSLDSSVDSTLAAHVGAERKSFAAVVPEVEQ